MTTKRQFELEEFKKFLEDFDDKENIVEYITFHNYNGSTDDEDEIIVEGEKDD